MDITMDPPATLGPLTRAQTRAIEAKVNSLLSESFVNMHESWVLPHGSVLCIIRYTGDAQGDPQVQAQATGEEAVQGREGTTPDIGRPTQFRHRTSDPVRTSDIEGHEGGNRGQKLCIGRRTSDRLRTSEVSDVRQTTDVRNPHDREFANASDVRWTSDVRHLGRPKPNGRPTSPAPDRQASTGPHRHDNFRTSEPCRTSETCLRAETAGSRPMYSPPIP